METNWNLFLKGVGDQDVDLWALAMSERELPGDKFSQFKKKEVWSWIY